MGIFDKIKDLAGQDKVSEGIENAIDKAGDLIDSATSGKFAEKIDQVQDMAKEKIDEAINAVKGIDTEAPVETIEEVTTETEAPVETIEEVVSEVTETPAEIVEEVTTDAIDETF